MNYLQKFQGGGSFGKAWRTARKAGLDKFQWNGRWYTTEDKADEKVQPKTLEEQIREIPKEFLGGSSPKRQEDQLKEVKGKGGPSTDNRTHAQRNADRFDPTKSDYYIANIKKGKEIVSESAKTPMGKAVGLTSAVLAAPAVIPYLASAGSAVLANPLGFAGGIAGSLYGGNAVNRGIERATNGQYSSVGNYISDKTGGVVSPGVGELANPGTWAGGGIGSVAGNTVMRVGRNIPTMWNNAVGAARNAPYINNGAGPRTVFDAESGQYITGNYTNQEVNNINRAIAESGKSSATKTTGYSKAGGGKQTGTRSGASGRPYTKGSTVGGGQTTGQQVKGGKFVASEVPEYQPLPWVNVPGTYGAMPTYAPGQGPVTPAPVVENRVEKVSEVSDPFTKWFSKQKEGTKQYYPGDKFRKAGWYLIDRGGSNSDPKWTQREVLKKNPGGVTGRVALDSSSVSQGRPSNPGIRELQGGWTPEQAQTLRLGNQNVDLTTGRIVERKEGGSINYLNSF